MNVVKRIVGVVISAAFTGGVLAALLYFPGKNDHSSTGLGPVSDWAWLGLVIGALVGTIIGAISGAVIVGFKLKILNAILFGLIFNIILAVVFFLVVKIEFLALILIFVGMANGAIVSLISVGRGDNFIAKS